MTISPATRWLLLVLLVCAAYQPVWHAGFVWDDDDHLTANPHLVDAAGLGRIWSSLEASRYYPLTLTSFWVQRQLWGLNPRPYHLVNVALHLLAGLAAYWVLRQLRLPAAGLAVAVWLVHPVNVESVAWITELKNTQSGVFFFLALGCFLRFDTTRDRRWYAGAVLGALAALLSKPSTVVLPAVLLLCLWWRRGRWIKRDWLLTAPFWLLSAAMSVLTIVEQRAAIVRQATTEWELGFAERLVVAGQAVVFYAGKLVWPVNLTFVYPRWEIDQRAVGAWLPVVALLGLGAGLWRWRRQDWARAALVGGGWFVAALAPVSGLINVYYFRYSFVADHFQYLASLGIITLGVAALAHGTRRLAPAWRTAGAGALLAVLGTLTWRQAQVYQSIESLWRDTLAKNPACWMAHAHWGCLLSDRGELTTAMDHLQEARRLNPTEASVRYNLALAYDKAGQFPEARAQYEEALRLKPADARTHNNLGLLLLTAGQVAPAIGHLEEALRLDPALADARNNLGLALLRAGRATEAEAQFAEILRFNPDHAEARHNLGVLAARAGRRDAAIRHFTEAVRLQPANLKARLQLGVNLAAVGRLPEAIACLEQLVRLKPGQAEAHYQLGLALEKADRFADAVPHFAQALRLDPNVGRGRDAP